MIDLEQLKKGIPEILPFKLNLGSGDQRIEGFINVDLHYPANLRDDIRVLSHIPNNSTELIYIGHVILYFTDNELSMCLEACYKKLMDGGRLVLEDPTSSEDWEWTYIRDPTEEVIPVLQKMKFKKISTIPKVEWSRHGDNIWTLEAYK